MKKITYLKLAILSILLCVSSSDIIAQSLMRKIPLQTKVENSNLIVEAKVVSKKSFWDQKKENIYTVNQLEVYKVFKGDFVTTVNVITEGGVVGLQAELVNPSLHLNIGDVGLFTLIESALDFNSEGKKSFKSYGRYQGFYKYNLQKDIAVNSSSKIKGISSTLYSKIISYTKESYIKVLDFDAKKSIKSIAGKGLMIPSSITFSPTTVTAGTKTVITISGSGFGTIKGKVGFSDANEGGAVYIDALDSQVLTWSDDEITAEVPSRAGTGKIRVTDSNDDSAISSADLTVTYSEINVESDAVSSGNFVAYPTRHIDDDSNGGYTWQMFTDFDADADAKASFLRAFESWRCETKINWVIGSTTTVDVVANDGVNVIRFDNGLELDSETLGVCTSRFSGCFASGGTDINWYVTELDIVFNDSVDNAGSSGVTETWNFGPDNANSSEYDFESVALHELGHGHQLAHVINTSSDVMHYNFSNGETLKVLASSNIVAASNVQSRSTGAAVCGESVMTDYAGSCTLAIDETELNSAVTVYPNPANGVIYIKNDTRVNLERVIVYDLSGRLVSNIDISNSSRVKTINLQGVSKGVYFIKIASDEASITRKLVIE